MTGLTIGRIVRYHPTDEEYKNLYPLTSIELAALIVAVDDKDTGAVRLHVFSSLDSSTLFKVASYSKKSKPGTWHWPPGVKHAKRSMDNRESKDSK